MNMFKRSANELKSVQCLAVTGILIAVYVVMNSYLAFNSEIIKITFGYLALAAVGMLFGPVAAVIAAIACDLISAVLVGQGINLFFTIPKIIEGLIYGIFLYGYAGRSGNNSRGVMWAAWQVMRIVIARLLVMSLVYFVLNSYLILIIYSPASASGLTFWAWAWARSGVKNVIQFPVDLALMFTFLPAIALIYNKSRTHFAKEKAVKT
jgi:ECF transporter S component (folate family)